MKLFAGIRGKDQQLVMRGTLWFSVLFKELPLSQWCKNVMAGRGVKISWQAGCQMLLHFTLSTICTD